MIHLFETEFIYNLVILVYPNDLIGRRRVIAISIFEMVLTYYNDKWKYRPIIRINILNYNDPFPIIKLYSFNFPMLVV